MPERRTTSSAQSSKPTSAQSPSKARAADKRAEIAADQSSSPSARSSGGTPVGGGSVVDRRMGIDRRELAKLKALANGETPEESTTGLERRRGPGRRLSDFTRAAEEGELTQEQFLFIMAIEEFKRANDKQFPTWSDVLEVVRLLGYRKTMASELNLRSAEDWRESPIAPSNVRAPRWAEHILVDAARARLRESGTQSTTPDEATGLRRAA